MGITGVCILVLLVRYSCHVISLDASMEKFRRNGAGDNLQS